MSHIIEKTEGGIGEILSAKALDTDIEYWQRELGAVKSTEVEKLLKAKSAGGYSIKKLVTLLSPAASNYLEEMAQLAHNLTIQRFGRTMKLYAPLYLSNFCSNSCRYCGFNKENDFQRRRLTIEEALAEADVIASYGFRDILLVTSEDKAFITVDYLAELATKLRHKFSDISVEIYQLQEQEYAKLFAAGIDGVTIYQETYNRDAYNYYHRGGAKANYKNRLDIFAINYHIS